MIYSENLEMEERDFVDFLTSHLMSYRFYSGGKNPMKIILPKFDKVASVPIEYAGEEKESDVADRPQRARRDYKVNRAVSASRNTEPEPDEKE